MIILRSLLVSVLLLCVACDSGNRQDTDDSAASARVENALVVTSNYPLYYFASRITEGVDGAPKVVFPDIDGDPTYWTPSAEQIQVLQSADIVILNGAGAEPWLNLITLDRSHLFDTSANIAERLVPLAGTVQHQHGPEGEHSHQGTAFTTWLDPQLAMIQAESITDALASLSPDAEKPMRANMAKLNEDLVVLDNRMGEVFAQLGDRPILFSHPVYQYLQHRYSLNGVSVHWEPDVDPTIGDWIEVRKILAAHRATIMIWEDEPLLAMTQRLSDIGVKTVVFHTAANEPGEGDFLSVMRKNIERLDSQL
jgi:zinc transport system substrate-binding protein